MIFETFDTHKARDEFYACLERESNKKPTEIATVGLLYPVECKKCRDKFVNQCRPTWVKSSNFDEYNKTMITFGGDHFLDTKSILSLNGYELSFVHW